MVIYGITNNGFTKKTYSDISNSIDARARHLFGDNVDLSPGSPIKNICDISSIELAKLWATLESVYNNGFISTAGGSSLNELAKIVGIERTNGTVATGEITFFRSSVLPIGETKVIEAGTMVATVGSFPTTYITTSTGYFEPEINDEVYPAQTSAFTVFDTVNTIGTIISIVGSDTNNYESGATFDGRTITTSTEVPSGVSLTITYKPLSITIPIQASRIGTSSNVDIGTIEVLSDTLSYIHYISNEDVVTGGTDSEDDERFRARILNTSNAIGNATNNALEYTIGNITGVTNVIVNDTYIIEDTQVPVADTTKVINVTNTPIYRIISATGATSGAFTIDTFDDNTGNITLVEQPVNGENVTVVYEYEDISAIGINGTGRIKIHVSGGDVGDANTEDTIVYAIENTRAAGIQAIGYGTNSELAEGSNDSPFSWFYRIGEAECDITVSVTYDPESTLSAASKLIIEAAIVSDIEEFITSLDANDVIYKNKILQLAISGHNDIINATVDVFKVKDVDKTTSLTCANTEIFTVGTILVAEEGA